MRTLCWTISEYSKVPRCPDCWRKVKPKKGGKINCQHCNWQGTICIDTPTNRVFAIKNL